MSYYTREVAKEYIEKVLKEQKPIKTGTTLPIRPQQKFDTYQFNIEYLVPNVLNDRISWKVREYEAENNRKLSIDNEQDIEYIYSLVENEYKDDNEKTKKNIAEIGQQIDGIITKDGIIIDGNRRATLLRKLYKGDARKYNKNINDFKWFNAIVLTEDIDDKEIMALETQIQIGEDKKREYNPICLYIKVDNLTKAGYNDAQIASYMNCSEGDVKQRKDVFKIMNEYLDVIGKPNHFSLLDGLEDQFINTKNVFKKMDTETYVTEDWDYTDEDVNDFKQVCYDYMRSKFEGKAYRNILVGKTNKTDGVFIKKSVWDNFLKNHNEIIDKANPQNEHDWENLKRKFEGNLNSASKQLKETLDDKNINSIIQNIEYKIIRLKELIEDKVELSDENIEKLKEFQKEFYRITKDLK